MADAVRTFQRVAVIGAGAWGTTLARLLADTGLHVRLWAYEREVVEAIRHKHENTLFLPGVRLPTSLSPTIAGRSPPGQRVARLRSPVPCRTGCPPADRSSALRPDPAGQCDKRDRGGHVPADVSGDPGDSAARHAPFAGVSFRTEFCGRGLSRATDGCGVGGRGRRTGPAAAGVVDDAVLPRVCRDRSHWRATWRSAQERDGARRRCGGWLGARPQHEGRSHHPRLGRDGPAGNRHGGGSTHVLWALGGR